MNAIEASRTPILVAGQGICRSQHAPSPALLTDLGQTACNGFGASGLDYVGVVRGFTTSNAAPTNDEATALVRSAVVNLCPQYQDRLPAS